MENIDLHIHSNFSDGKLSPKEIIDIAIKNKIQTIAITDHDGIDAYTSEIINYAQKNNINLIKGIEISTTYKKCGIHVLGYNIDINNKKFQKKIKDLKNARHIYLKEVSKKLEENGYVINTQKLDKIESVTKAHIALDIIENNKEILLKQYGHIPEKGEFIETMMNEGCKCYVKKNTISPKEASDLIKSVGGKVVLAHPVAYKYENNVESKEILELLKEMNCNAIEGDYIYIDKNNQEINEIDYWNKFAQENNLISTIGSDFHLEDGIRPLIGFKNKNIKVSNIDKILEYLEQ